MSPGGDLLFGIELFLNPFTPPPNLPPFIPPAGSGLESFRIRPNGRLLRAPGLAARPPPRGGAALPARPEGPPDGRLIYVGFVVGNAPGTYSYDAAGALSLVHLAPNGGQAICWIEVNAAGTVAYTSNSASDSISAYSLADPRHPVEVQVLDLKGPRAFLPPTPPLPNIYTTTPFQLSLDPSGKFLYVLNRESTIDDSFPQGNAIHILRVGGDGLLGEIAESPVILPESAVPARAHPQGVVVL